MTRYLLPVLFLAACRGCADDKAPSLAEDEAENALLVAAADTLLDDARAAVAQGCLSTSATASLLNVGASGAYLLGDGEGCGETAEVSAYTYCATGADRPLLQVQAEDELCDYDKDDAIDFEVECATAAGILVARHAYLDLGFVTRIEPGRPLLLPEGAIYTLRRGAAGPWDGAEPDEIQGMTHNLIQNGKTSTTSCN